MGSVEQNMGTEKGLMIGGITLEDPGISIST